MSERDRPAGQRIFTCGHSFHTFVPELLADMAREFGIEGHQTVGISAIGASRALQHWQVPEADNAAKTALRSGQVDVLTLSCMTRPDEGIRHFAKLAFAHNPEIRVTLQELWLPEDRFPFDAKNRVRTAVEQFNAATMADLRTVHAAYFRTMEDYVGRLNDELGRRVVFIAPDAQAALALRERIIAGAAPGLVRQSDLFLDPWGHAAHPLRLLAACCHFAVIYRRSPLGLSVPGPLADTWTWGDELPALLQQLAWEAAGGHPMSGVTAAP